MTVTAQAPLNDDTRRLIDAVVRDLVKAQSSGGGGTRDVGGDVKAPGGVVGPQDDQEAQRFFGGILSSIIQNVVPVVVPHVLGMLQQRRRDLGLPEQRDADSVQRDLGSILAALLPKLIEAVPALVNQFAGKPAPRSAEEETQRFFPLLGTLIPAIASAIPGIIGAFNQQRGVDATPPAISDPETQRFFGSLIAAVAPTLIQAAPSLLGAIFGRRDVDQSASASTPAW